VYQRVCVCVLKSSAICMRLRPTGTLAPVCICMPVSARLVCLLSSASRYPCGEVGAYVCMRFQAPACTYLCVAIYALMYPCQHAYIFLVYLWPMYVCIRLCFLSIYIYIRCISLPLCLSQNCTKKLDIEKLRCQNLPVGTESFKLLEHTFPAETSSRLNGFLA
jgi:hypothetical protein